MVDEPIGPPQPPRQCGGCTLCCLVFHVPELGKLAGEWCPNCTADGCRIYASRPAICRDYECLWLHSPQRVPEALRPDRTAVVLNEFAEAELPILELYECSPGAADRICDRLGPALAHGWGLLIYQGSEPRTLIPPTCASPALQTQWVERFRKRLEERRRSSTAVVEQIRRQRGF